MNYLAEHIVQERASGWLHSKDSWWFPVTNFHPRWVFCMNSKSDKQNIISQFHLEMERGWHCMRSHRYPFVIPRSKNCDVWGFWCFSLSYRLWVHSPCLLAECIKWSILIVYTFSLLWSRIQYSYCPSSVILNIYSRFGFSEILQVAVR